MSSQGIDSHIVLLSSFSIFKGHFAVEKVSGQLLGDGGAAFGDNTTRIRL
jgi:hypothetical protein